MMETIHKVGGGEVNANIYTVIRYTLIDSYLILIAIYFFNYPFHYFHFQCPKKLLILWKMKSKEIDRMQTSPSHCNSIWTYIVMNDILHP